MTTMTKKVDLKFKEELLLEAEKYRTSDPEMAEGLEDLAYGRVVSLEEVMKEVRASRAK